MDLTKLKTGDLVVEHTKFSFSHFGSYISGAIRFFQWTSNFFRWKYARWNHAGIILVKDGVPYVVDSIAKGAVKRSFESWANVESKEWKVFREKNWMYADPRELKSRIESVIGAKYDYPSLILAQLLYRLTFRILWLGLKGNNASKKLYCSELYAYVWRENYPKWHKMSASDILEKGKLIEIKL